MKTNTRLSVGLAGALCINFLLPCMFARAGNLTVDSLTVVNSLTSQGEATGVLPTTGKGYVIVEQLPGYTPAERGQKLLAAYTKAKGMSPSVDNRITVLIPPGTYDLGADGITLDTSYVDLIGMVPVQMTKRVKYMSDGALWIQTVPVDPTPCGLVLISWGFTIRQTANHVRIANMIVKAYENFKAYWPDDNLPDTVVEHVSIQNLFRDSFTGSMRTGIEYSGVYRDCVADGYAFGFEGTASGAFEDCVGGEYSFGCVGVASGTFRNCTAEVDDGFGAIGEANGIFENCYGGYGSFGGDWGTGITGGKFINCRGGNSSFGAGYDLPASAVLLHCRGGDDSFGTFYTSSDDFNFSTKRMDLRIQINPEGDLSMGTFTQ